MVVTVIGTMAGLLLPAVEQSRGTARRVACQSNLRQWAFAAQHYADVHKGRLPRRGQGIRPFDQPANVEDWFNALPPYMEGQRYIDLSKNDKQPQVGGGNFWVCPEVEQPADLGQKGFFAYGMNMALSVWSAANPDHIDRVGPKQTMVFMADGPGQFCAVLPSRQPYSPIARHNGLVNIAFLDCHVAAFAGDDVGCGVGDPQRPEIRWFTPNGSWAPPPD